VGLIRAQHEGTDFRLDDSLSSGNPAMLASIRIHFSTKMRLPTVLALILLMSPSLSLAETCREIHGRAVFYSGDGQLRIWHIGTHHEFSFCAESCGDDRSADLLFQYLKRDGSKLFTQTSPSVHSRVTSKVLRNTRRLSKFVMRV